MRKHTFVTGEYYHVYNRGVDKRNLFKDEQDIDRFIETVNLFSNESTFGGVEKSKLLKNQNTIQFRSPTSKLIKIVAYCILDNHYHFVLQQVIDGGVAKFMQRFGTGYTKYFNTRHRRVGALFQGRYKSKHIEDNNYLLRLFAYVNYNYKIHQNQSPTSKFVKSSERGLFKGGGYDIQCDPSVVLDQFGALRDLRLFMDDALVDIRRNKKKDREELPKDLISKLDFEM